MQVNLQWATAGGDEMVAYLARISNPDNQGNDATAPKLVKYLIDHQHWSPFEMVNVCLEIVCPRDIARQILRHRSFTFQEFSQRYADVGVLPQADLRHARMQDPKNRQKSIHATDADTLNWWDEAQEEVREFTSDLYTRALSQGIAKEVARAILPEGLTQSRLYMNGTLRSWMHFYQVRSGHGAQKEIQDLAHMVGKIIEPLFPVSWAALTTKEG